MNCRVWIVSGGVLAFAACGTPEVEVDDAAAAPEGTVEVRAVDYGFVMPDTIPPGWTTFRFSNEGAETHFMLINRLPEGKSLADYEQEVAQPFVEVWDSLRAGSLDKAGAGMRLGEIIPEWYATVVAVGGPGFLAPGLTGETTIYLEPGNYEVECYVKSPDGQFHAALGMAKLLVVAGSSDPSDAPLPDATVTVSNSQLSLAGTLEAGRRTIAVTASEHPPYGLGNDVHLARLDSAVPILELARWMDWMELDGLAEPSPAVFLGGVHEMPAGQTGYFEVELAPGNYALVTESSAERPIVHQFMVE